MSPGGLEIRFTTIRSRARPGRAEIASPDSALAVAQEPMGNAAKPAMYPAPMAQPRKRSAKSPVESAPASASTSLRVRTPGDAISALLQQRNRLLKQIARKQQDVIREREQQQVLAQALSEGMMPLIQERADLMREVRQGFAELLAEGRLSRTAQKKVAQVYRWVKQSGELDPLDGDCDDARDDDGFTAGNPAQEDDAQDPAPSSRRGPSSREGRSVESANHGGGQPGHESLRGIFRRLIMALHPDLAQEAHEQQRRTDVMKEVTRAYEEGDLARLLEIEQQWLSGGKVRISQDDEAAQCAALERIVRELVVQERALSSQLKWLKKSTPLAAFFGTRRVSREVRDQQVEMYLNEASSELEPLRQIRDYVKAFSERKISLAEFLRGPRFAREDELDIAEAMLSSLLESIDTASSASSRSRRGRSAGKRRVTIDDAEGCPF